MHLSAAIENAIGIREITAIACTPTTPHEILSETEAIAANQIDTVQIEMQI
jgi:hypothetical protein